MIQYDEEECFLLLLFRRRGSVVPKALSFAVPACLATLVLTLLPQASDGHNAASFFRLEDISNSSQIYAATTAVVFILLSFRNAQALSRFWEGTGLLHQMRAEWYDSVSCLMTFSRSAIEKKPEATVEFRNTVCRLMSLCHGSALDELKVNDNNDFECVGLDLDAATLHFLDACKTEYKFNRVEVLLHMIKTLVNKAAEDGVITVAPPILSRIYQTLSRGFVNLLNAKKIKATRFPYPYVQLIGVMLLLEVLWVPFMISATIPKVPGLACFVSFVLVFSMFALNEIACQLEMPFGIDDNDLPLDDFQHEMNNSLKMLLHPMSDMIVRCMPMDDGFDSGSGPTIQDTSFEVGKQDTNLFPSAITKVATTFGIFGDRADKSLSGTSSTSMFAAAKLHVSRSVDHSPGEKESPRRCESAPHSLGVGRMLDPHVEHAELESSQDFMEILSGEVREDQGAEFAGSPLPVAVRASPAALVALPPLRAPELPAAPLAPVAPVAPSALGEARGLEGRLDGLLVRWLQRSEEQLAAMRANTSALSALRDQFPAVLRSSAVSSATSASEEILGRIVAGGRSSHTTRV